LPTSPSPRLGEPRLGVATSVALETSGLALSAQPPIPLLQEPDDPFLGIPSDEPLVQPQHDRIVVLSSYAQGGWTNAVSECWLRQGVIDRLLQACHELPDGFGLAVHDGWRSHDLQAELLAAADAEGLPEGLIANPTTDPNRPAPHQTGGAVDVTLTIDGIPIAPGTDFDEMIPASRVAALETESGPDREARRLLYWAMQRAGFVVFVEEWWHFEFGTRRWGAITGGSARYGIAAPPE
jgi:D-alanyl-D-alanine dipeptidase